MQSRSSCFHSPTCINLCKDPSKCGTELKHFDLLLCLSACRGPAEKIMQVCPPGGVGYLQSVECEGRNASPELPEMSQQLFLFHSDEIAPLLCLSLHPMSCLFSQADRRTSNVKPGQHPSPTGCVLLCLSRLWSSLLLKWVRCEQAATHNPHSFYTHACVHARFTALPPSV